MSTPDPFATDSTSGNFGSAFSSPGALSSTSLSTPSASSSADLSSLGGSAFSGTPADYSALNTGYFSPTNLGTDSTYATAPGTATTPAPGAPATSTATQGGGFDWGSIGKTVGGLAPSLIAGGIGLSQAKGAQKSNDAFAQQLQALGGPYTAAGQALLRQFESGNIRPDQANFANLATTQGQSLIDSGAGLSSIAQAAYKDYQAGKLPQADEQRLSDQTAAQKQEMRARLAQSGITDSSILAGYDAQIENQANINRQDLLDKRFATGNTAYDEWLKSTNEGQQLKLQGAQFASQSLDNMLTQALSLGAEGMGPITRAIELKMQSDAALSQQVQQLMGNLASSYAYSQTGGRVPQGGGGGGGTAGAVSSVANLASKAFSGGGSGVAPGDSTAVTYNPDTTGAANSVDLSALNNATGGVDTSNIQPADTGSPPPSTAGGEAAGTNWGALGTAAGYGAGALGVYSGLKSGGAVGDTRAALGATQLAGKAGLVSPGVNAAAGNLMNVLGIYSGLKQGGVAGYSGAGVNAAQLGAKAGAFGGASGAVGKFAGAAAVPLALYSEIKSWQSGATASDALSGAETGAAIGSIVPGVGTLVGAVLGGIAGGISSLFGSGKKGAAAGSWDQLTKSNALKSTPGRNFDGNSWSEAFKGMLDEGNNIFAGGGKDRHKDPDALAKPLEAQIKSGMAKLGPNATTDQVYNQVIVPWMQTSGSGLNWSVLQNEPTQQLMIKSAVDRVLAGEPIVRAEMQSSSSSADPRAARASGGRR